MPSYEAKHLREVRELAPECMVLLKSDGSFPLNGPGKIALYGSGARRTYKGGRGSADVNVKYYPTVEDGLRHAGFDITTSAWLDAYEQERLKGVEVFRAWLKEKIAAGGMEMLMENLSIVMPEPEYDLPLDGEGETAVYVLSRLCGEGVDRQDVPGDYRLSKTEIRDILRLARQYPRFLLVLNTACIVDLSPVVAAVPNILLLSQVGSAIGDAFADVLLGKAYPSGKLAATWMADDEAYTIGEFGIREETRYREGIYVGYRYVDSVGNTPLFPFGFGLGYTSFEITPGIPSLKGTKTILPVKVRNTGHRPGKEVVQLYVSVPEGRINQPAQTLAAFQKTRELAPGEVCDLTLSFCMESLASTDTEHHARILEPGNYLLRIGSSSRHTVCMGAVSIKETIIIERIHKIGGETDFVDWQPNACHRAAAAVLFAPQNSDYPILVLDAMSFSEKTILKPAIDPEASAIVKSLTDEELANLCTGDFVGEGSKNVIGDAAITMVGATGETTGRFKHLGIPNLIMADGPSGLRLPERVGVDEHGAYAVEPENPPITEIENKLALLPEAMLKALAAMFDTGIKKPRHGEIHEQVCTAIPVATALAQSWNPDLAETCGDLVAQEMEHFGIHIWLAPALNIQRHPLCGRTFEYFSEDPLLSGRMAAAITRGVQKHPGCSVTIKHFICNNQETNRFRTSSNVNERALRDIYARGFEIAVKEAQPHALMSSYNLLNGVHTSERHDLLETLLREEWGYQGMVMSDWMTGDENPADKTNKYRKFATAPSVKAGNDLIMPGGKAHYDNLLHALHDKNPEYTLTRKEMETCAARNIMLAWRLKGKQGE